MSYCPRLQRLVHTHLLTHHLCVIYCVSHLIVRVEEKLSQN